LDGFARFLRLYRSGSGDYNHDRQRWLNGATIQEIMAEIERRDKVTLIAELEDIAEHCASLPALDGRPADEILGFDEHGIPR
jgi:hypothetical protein